jgi:hypothetical protein
MGRVSKLCEPVDVIFFFQYTLLRNACACQCTYINVCKKCQTWEMQPLNLSGTVSPRTVVLGSGLCVLSVGNDRSALETWGEMLAENLSWRDPYSRNLEG